MASLAPGNKKEDEEKASEVFLVKESPNFGRYAVATRPVGKKALVLDEAPVMCAPWPIDDKVTFDEPLCLGCCNHMKRKRRADIDDQEDLEIVRTMKVETDEEYFARLMKKVNRCTRCSWPVCSKACEELELHRDNECQLFAQSKLPYPPPGDRMNIVTASVMIQLIRCLLVKRNNGRMWREKVLTLQSQTALGTRPWDFHMILDDIKEMLPEVEGTLAESREECCKILSIININAFSNTFNRFGDGFSGCSICLYTEASMIAHSCTPNCWWTLTEDPSHRIVIKASEDLQKDEMITVCYSNQYSVLGTLKREEMFRSIGGFICKCRRCVDPSEFGSYVSGVLCEHCLTGYKLPEDPTDRESKWRCELCGHTETAEVICTIVRVMESRLSSIVEDQPKPVPLLVRFLENCKSLVHNNHWIVTQTEDAIMKEWARDPNVRLGGTSPEDILVSCEYFISLCFHVLSVREIVAPGLSFHRARYLLFYARTRMARLEFMMGMMEDPSRYNLSPPMYPTCGWKISPVEKGDDTYFQSIREEFQEILQLYHEVIEYRQMSCAQDEEIKGEIEHLMHVITPIVQMEPHHKRILELVVKESGVETDNNKDQEESPASKNGDDSGSGCSLS